MLHVGAVSFPHERPQRKLVNTRAQTRMSSYVQITSQAKAEGLKSMPVVCSESMFAAWGRGLQFQRSAVICPEIYSPKAYYRLKPSTRLPLELLRGNATCQAGRCANGLLRASLGVYLVYPQVLKRGWALVGRGLVDTLFSNTGLFLKRKK